MAIVIFITPTVLLPETVSHIPYYPILTSSPSQLSLNKQLQTLLSQKKTDRWKRLLFI
jgi:hypothetical protein